MTRYELIPGYDGKYIDLPTNNKKHDEYIDPRNILIYGHVLSDGYGDFDNILSIANSFSSNITQSLGPQSTVSWRLSWQPWHAFHLPVVPSSLSPSTARTKNRTHVDQCSHGLPCNSFSCNCNSTISLSSASFVVCSSFRRLSAFYQGGKNEKELF